MSTEFSTGGTDDLERDDGVPSGASELKAMLERKMLSVVETHLRGIDMTEIEDESGWWETSTGASFGEERLALIRAGISAQAEAFIEYLRSND